jgi:pimeloyl-ACP methyl ester carboxylesterase
MADDNSLARSPSPREAEDEPQPLAPGLAPEVAAPLARFAGAEPESPPWFKWALAQEPERSQALVQGANIEVLSWGQRGKPGLVFVHGNSAHADWWSFIAPFFAQDFRVAALSFSGMGGSDWRERYSFELFGEEIAAAAQVAGLNDAPEKPVYIGHSFGGSQVFFAATRHPERMRAAILVDTGFGGPPSAAELAKMEAEARARGEAPQRWRSSNDVRANRVYPSLEAALARFRFLPAQKAGNLFVADFIARRSLKRAPLPDGSGEGWTWRFDPGLWNKLDRTLTPQSPAGGAPLIHIHGDNSDIIRRHGRGDGRGGLGLPAATPTIIIPDSEHHVMVDQPLALVAALRAALATWPAAAAG